MVKTPNFIVKSSTNLKSWKKVSKLEAVAKESEWGRPLAVRFKLTAAAQRFFVVQIYED